MRLGLILDSFGGRKMKTRVVVLVLLGSLIYPSSGAAEENKDDKHKWFADALLRYEDETGSVGIKDRERMRVIAHAGVKSHWSANWSSTLRLSTGLKNKQNVPAITVHRFSQQPQPDSDIFIERAFVTGKFDKISVNIGKIPWGSKQITDMFWDRHLNPIGFSSNIKVANGHVLHLSHFKPLDGASDTVGNMSVLQWQFKYSFDGVDFAIMPWWAKYNGEQGATYAKKDTSIDNEFYRISAYMKSGKWRLGTDIGKGDPSISDAVKADEDTSFAVELTHGGLKKVGAILTQFRVFKVEKYAVVGEFAQNAVARYATNNIEGWDLRVRKKMSPKWWLGMRFSDTEAIVDSEQKGRRFRIEAKYNF